MNDHICFLCKRSIKHSIKLNCNHSYCFTCIKFHCKNRGYFCPKCSHEVNESIINVSPSDVDGGMYSGNYYWLYEAKYKSGWWCYDLRSNAKLENIYKDYLSINKGESANISSLKIKKIDKVSPFNEMKYTVDLDLLNMLEKNNSGIEQYSNPPKNNKTFNCVQFKCAKDNNSKSVALPQTYTLKIGKGIYVVNFDIMAQINREDIRKQRTIKRVFVPKNITDKHNHLKIQFDVKGVGGMRYKNEKKENLI